MRSDAPEAFDACIGKDSKLLNRGKQTMKQDMIAEIRETYLAGMFEPKNGLWEFSEYIKIKERQRSLVAFNEVTYAGFKEGVKAMRRDKKDGYSECLESRTLRTLLNRVLFSKQVHPVPFPAHGKEYSLAAVLYMCASLDAPNTIQWGTRPITPHPGIAQDHYLNMALASKNEAISFLATLKVVPGNKFFSNYILEIKSNAMRNIKFKSLKEAGKINTRYQVHRVDMGKKEIAGAVKKILGGINQVICSSDANITEVKSQEAFIISMIMRAFYFNPACTDYREEDIKDLFQMEGIYTAYRQFCKTSMDLDSEEVHSYSRMAATMDNRNVIDRTCTNAEFMLAQHNKAFYEHRLAGPGMLEALFGEEEVQKTPKSYPVSALKSPQRPARSIKGPQTVSTMDMEAI